MLLLQYTLIYASVLIFVALGGMYSERSGVINLGLEGIMVFGALGGAFVLHSMPVETNAFVIVIEIFAQSYNFIHDIPNLVTKIISTFRSYRCAKELKL